MLLFIVAVVACVAAVTALDVFASFAAADAGAVVSLFDGRVSENYV